MHRLLLPLALIVAATGLMIRQARTEPAQLPPPIVVPPAKPAIESLGVSSCASMACHHGNSQRGSKGSEYSTWIAVDPHAKAYSALFKPESKQIDRNMGGKGEAHRNPLCLRCHGMGDHVPEALQADGVGCERCHGPAEKWKATHYRDGFDRQTKGFANLRDSLTVRAETCMKCHVGAATMEVDHDLIAAGHPRLRFEYAAYYAKLPRHWEENDKTRPGKDFEIRNWVIGQIIAARAATELLAHRTTKTDAWPEFAEYDCAGCHRQLKKDVRGTKPLGQLRWGSWYDPLVPTLAGETDPKTKEAIEASRTKIVNLMGDRLPTAKKVEVEAKALVGLLRKWEAVAAKNRYEPAQARKLMELLARLDQPVKSGWDGGAQVYLGLAAVHHGWTDLDEVFKDRLKLRDPILEMRKALIKPGNYDHKLMDVQLKQLRELLKESK